MAPMAPKSMRGVIRAVGDGRVGEKRMRLVTRGRWREIMAMRVNQRRHSCVLIDQDESVVVRIRVRVSALEHRLTFAEFPRLLGIGGNALHMN